MTLFIKQSCGHFHQTHITSATNLDNNEITQADFDRVTQSVQQAYQGANPGCSSDAHFAKKVEVTFGNRKIEACLMRDNDPLPERSIKITIGPDLDSLLAMLMSRQQ